MTTTSEKRSLRVSWISNVFRGGEDVVVTLIADAFPPRILRRDVGCLTPSMQKGGEEMATFTAIAFNLFETIGLVQPCIEVMVREPVECTLRAQAAPHAVGSRGGFQWPQYHSDSVDSRQPKRRNDSFRTQEQLSMETKQR